MTRTEHLQWCKDRALEYARIGDASQAVASMLSDLGKHEGTRDSAGGTLASLSTMMLLSGQLNTPAEIEHFINGFN